MQNNFQFIEWGFKTWAFVNLKGVACYVSVLSSLLTVIMMMLISCDFNDANDNGNDDNNVALNNDCYEKR